jgi:argininosuccinate lyase
MSEQDNLRNKNTVGADEMLVDFVNSFKFDRRIFAADIRVSLSYCDALFGAGVFTRIESERVKNGLQTILKRADYDKNYFEEIALEDIHSFIETRLVQLVGESGRKLRVGKSHIDQSATALRLWLREEIEEISKLARELQKVLVESAENQKEAVLPAYKHLRRTHPILWAHWCLAYFEMLARDRERLDEVWRRVNVFPLGSGNSAGTSFEIDREEIARALNFEGVTANSLDAVSDSDFTIEFVGVCSLIMVHLSRLAEDLILYTSTEFNLINLNNAVSDNSNTKPQNKNIFALELIRGKAGRVFGHQTALLSTMKGLPLAYNKDLQEDKQAIFDTVDTVSTCLRTLQIIVKKVSVNIEKARFASTKGYLNTGELSDYLLHRNLPVKIVEQTVEQIVLYAMSKNKELDELSLDEMRKFSEFIDKDVFENLSLEQTLASKNQIGGTAPERVFEALEQARLSLDREEN